MKKQKITQYSSTETTKSKSNYNMAEAFAYFMMEQKQRSFS